MAEADNTVVINPFARKHQIAVGSRYGRLIAVGLGEPLISGGRESLRIRCACDCGSSVDVRANCLVNGKTSSCGCLRTDDNAVRSKTHGRTRTVEYRTWSMMKQRCHNPNQPGYPDYGGRGIAVCERWRSSFEAFLIDMGLRPSTDHSIDRIDNEKGYEPGNCRWATRVVQGRNKRGNHRLLHLGQMRTIQEIAEAERIDRWTLAARLRRGWPLERALKEPILASKRKKAA